MKFFKLNDFKTYCVYLDDYISLAIEKLNKSGLRTCFVITDEKKFLGTLTDGDIRKNILKSNFLQLKVKNFYHKSSYYQVFEENILKKINFKNDSLIIPITDKKLKLIGYNTPENFEYGFKKHTFVIPVGGFGKRLMPLTKKIPKPMIKIKNKPILEHIIINAKKFGYKNFILLTHYKRKIIENYFGNGKKKWGIEIKYSNEKIPLGTAGGLFNVRKQVTEDFILCNGDILSNIDFDDMLNFHIKNKCHFTIGAKIIEKKNKYGVLKTKNLKVLGIDEKPIDSIVINGGVYIINKKSLFKILKKNKFMNIDTVIKEFLATKHLKVLVYPINSMWYDLGSKQDLMKFK